MGDTFHDRILCSRVKIPWNSSFRCACRCKCLLLQKHPRNFTWYFCWEKYGFITVLVLSYLLKYQASSWSLELRRFCQNGQYCHRVTESCLKSIFTQFHQILLLRRVWFNCLPDFESLAQLSSSKLFAWNSNFGQFRLFWVKFYFYLNYRWSLNTRIKTAFLAFLNSH